MTATYWALGRRIVEQEQQGATRAGYGEELMARLANDLSARFGRGFGRRNLFQMPAFYLAYREVALTAVAEAGALPPEGRMQTVSALSPTRADSVAVATFPLPWSHYVRLLSVRNPEARRFYAAEALRGGWSVRQLDRQIGSQFYSRCARSRLRPADDVKTAAPGEAPPRELRTTGLL